MAEKKLYALGIFIFLSLFLLSIVYAENFQCLTNNDCQSGFIGNEYCNNNDVYKNFLNSSCINPSSNESYCSNDSISTLLTDCGENSYGDFGDNYCSNDSVYHSRIATIRGCQIIDSERSGCFSSLQMDEVLVHNCLNGCSDGVCNNETINETCISEGGTIPVILNPPVCCNGLTLIQPKSADIFGIAGICTAKCGNCVCDTETESAYNCPQDCNIRCYSDNDCGITGFLGSEFCSNNDVFKIFQNSTCMNPGTPESMCHVANNSLLINDCGNSYCDATGNNYCLNGNLYGSRLCYDKSCVNNACYTNITSTEILVQICNNGCSNSMCDNPQIIVCSSNSDCGNDGFIGNKECNNSNSYSNYSTYTCNNPGTNNSYCTNNIDMRLYEHCSNGCSDGECNDDNNDHQRDNHFFQYDIEDDNETNRIEYTPGFNFTIDDTKLEIKSPQNSGTDKNSPSSIFSNTLIIILAVLIILILILIIIISLI